MHAPITSWAAGSTETGKTPKKKATVKSKSEETMYVYSGHIVGFLSAFLSFFSGEGSTDTGKTRTKIRKQNIFVQNKSAETMYLYSACTS